MVQRISRLSIEELLGGTPPDDLVRRRMPRWPSTPEASGDFARLFPEAAHYAVVEADAILAGRQRLFGEPHDVGIDPDWDFAPTDPGLALFAADPKFPWEVARLAALPRLGVAHVVTGRARYVEGAAAILDSWCRLPVGEGIHFRSALEVGVRLIALTQAFHFFGGSTTFAGERNERLLRRIALEAAWLEGHRSIDRVVAGNHLIGELAGLVVVDLMFPELGRDRRLEENLDRLVREATLQVAPDGVSREQSTTYGRFVADFMAAVLASAGAAGRAIDDALRDRAASLAEWLLWVSLPDGTLPIVGDNDSGRGADWGEPAPSHDARGVALSLAVLTGRVRFPPGISAPPGPDRFPAGGETVYWWCGLDGLARLLTLLGRTPAGAASAAPTAAARLFPDGGQVVVRGSSAPGSAAGYLFVRCGRYGHGLPKPSAHSHADFMAPVVVLAGRTLLVDPGNHGYTTVGGERDAFRVEAAHSTLAFDGLPLAIPGEAFRWTQIPPRGSLELAEGEGEFRVAGSWKSAGRTVAARRVIVYNLSRSSIEIDDDWSVRGAIPAFIRQRWRLPAGAEATPAACGTGFRVALPGGGAFHFRIDPAADIAVESGSVAPGYARRAAAPVVTVSRAGSAAGRARTTIEAEQGRGDERA